MSHITRNDLHKHFILTITFLLYTFLFTLLLLSIERFTSIIREVYFNHSIGLFNHSRGWVFQSRDLLSLSLGGFHFTERFVHFTERVILSISRGCSFYWEIYLFHTLLDTLFHHSTTFNIHLSITSGCHLT